MTARGWNPTFTGKKFWPWNPNPADVDIVDIAHGLAQTNRFNRQAKFPYTVAQHSVLLANNCPSEMALLALLHDAHEAYSPYGDVPSPHKTPEVVAMEACIDRAISARFDLPCPIKNKAIAALDARILLDEKVQVMTPTDHDWQLPARLEPLGIKIDPWPWQVARKKFMDAFNRYSKMYRLHGGWA